MDKFLVYMAFAMVLMTVPLKASPSSAANCSSIVNDTVVECLPCSVDHSNSQEVDAHESYASKKLISSSSQSLSQHSSNSNPDENVTSPFPIQEQDDGYDSDLFFLFIMIFFFFFEDSRVGNLGHNLSILILFTFSLTLSILIQYILFNASIFILIHYVEIYKSFHRFSLIFPFLLFIFIYIILISFPAVSFNFIYVDIVNSNIHMCAVFGFFGLVFSLGFNNNKYTCYFNSESKKRDTC